MFIYENLLKNTEGESKDKITVKACTVIDLSDNNFDTPYILKDL